ncbi:MAG: TRM11 family SAM-dependent methyltransferase [Christensenellaceae bacterium]|jgi:tRNA G10  N-methylase Trm11
MNDILTLVKETQTLSSKARREALFPYIDNTSLSLLVNHMLAGEDIRLIARALADLATRKQVIETLARLFSIRQKEVSALFSAEDAKARKNIAELLGRIDADAFADVLIHAYEKEETEFVKPSIILALGNAKHSKTALAYLQSLDFPATDDKHISAQKAAHIKALDALTAEKTERIFPLASFRATQEVFLLCANGRVSQMELSELGYAAKILDTRHHYLSLSNIKNFTEIYRARSFLRAGFLVAQYKRIGDALTPAFFQKLSQVSQNTYGAQSLSYRLDIIDKEMPQQKRKVYTEKIISGIAGNKALSLRNSASNYDIELQFICTGKGVYVCVFPGSLMDTRFSYRMEAISASIHPAVAASVMYYAKPYFKKTANVLDPFCGAGTMLFERGQYPASSLSGADKSRHALSVARQNEEASNISIHFFPHDATLPFRGTYDEVIANMPFGLRVSNHKENETLYRAFLKNLTVLLKENGHAFLFTNEKKLLLSLLEETSFTVVARANFSAGGLYPSLFILQKA